MSRIREGDHWGALTVLQTYDKKYREPGGAISLDTLMADLECSCGKVFEVSLVYYGPEPRLLKKSDMKDCGCGAGDKGKKKVLEAALPRARRAKVVSSRRPHTVYLEDKVVLEVDKWAAEREMSWTRAVEMLVQAGMEATK